MLTLRINGGFILGLDAENIRRLQAGEPIQVDLAEFGGPAVRILIAAGETLPKLAEDIANGLGLHGQARTTLLAVASAKPDPGQTIKGVAVVPGKAQPS